VRGGIRAKASSGGGLVAIEVKCPGCGKTFRVAESAAGKKGACPHCGTFVVVARAHFENPSSRPAPAEAADAWQPGAVFPVSEGHRGRVHVVAASRGGRLALSGGEDGTLRFWDTDTGRQELEIDAHEGGVRAVAFDPGGNFVISGGKDARVRIWKISSGKCVRDLEGHEDVVNAAAFCPRGGYCLSASSDGTIRIWELSSSKCRKVLKKHRSAVTSLCCDPEGEFFLSGGGDRLVRGWRMGKWKPADKFKGHGGAVLDLSIGRGGALFLSGSSDRTAALWDIGKHRPVRVLSGHEAPVTSVALAPDGSLAATGGNDWTIKVWDVESGRCRKVIELDEHSVTSLAFEPDSHHLLAADTGGRIALYEAGSGQLIQAFGGVEGTVTVMCPACRRRLALAPGLIEREGRCPYCEAEFRAVAYAPVSSREALERAEAAAGGGDYQRAFTFYAEALEHQCDNFEAYLGAIRCRYNHAEDLAEGGGCREAIGELKEGLEVFRRAQPWPAEHISEARKLAHETAFLAARISRYKLSEARMAREFCRVAQKFYTTPEVEDLLAHLDDHKSPENGPAGTSGA